MFIPTSTPTPSRRLTESSIKNIKLDEVDEIKNAVADNFKTEKVTNKILSSFEIKSDLNGKIWSGDKLNKDARNSMLRLGKDFFDSLELPSKIKLLDIYFLGSLSNYNWSEYSDIDLHIIIDKSLLEGDDTVLDNFFWLQKKLWGETHDLTIFGYPVEMYVQDKDEKNESTSVYSVMKDEWILKPEKEQVKINKKEIKKKAESYISKLSSIRDDYKNKKYQKVVTAAEKINDKVYKMRKGGLKKDGEFSIENLAFKALRRTNFMDVLTSFKDKAYDRLLSVSENLKTKSSI